MLKKFNETWKNIKRSNLEITTIMSELKNILYEISEIVDIRLPRKKMVNLKIVIETI